MGIIIKIFYYIISTAILLTGCGGSDNNSTSDTNVTSPANLAIKSMANDPLIHQVESFKVDDLVHDIKNISEDNFVNTYKKLEALKFVGTPEFKTTFNINPSTENNNTNFKHASNSIQNLEKVIYENSWGRKDQYDCTNTGSLSKEVQLIPRGNLAADTYKASDKIVYVYVVVK